MNREEGYGFFNNMGFEPEGECPECGAVLEEFDSVRSTFTCEACGIRVPYQPEDFDGEAAEN